MKRIALPSLLVVACVACGDQTTPVEPERAVPPTAIAASHNPNHPADVEYTIEAEGFCPFVVRFEVSGKEKTIELPGGRILFLFPGLETTATNLDNGKSKTLTITGSYHVTVEENGNVVFRVTGRNLLGDPEAGLVLAIGNFSFAFDAAGELVQPLQGKGQLVDICELLA